MDLLDILWEPLTIEASKTISEPDTFNEHNKENNAISSTNSIKEVISSKIFVSSPELCANECLANTLINLEDFDLLKKEVETNNKEVNSVWNEQIREISEEIMEAPPVIKDQSNKREGYICHVVIRNRRQGSFIFHIRMILKRYTKIKVKKSRGEIQIRVGEYLSNGLKVIKKAKMLAKKSEESFSVYIYK